MQHLVAVLVDGVGFLGWRALLLPLLAGEGGDGGAACPVVTPLPPPRPSPARGGGKKVPAEFESITLKGL